MNVLICGHSFVHRLNAYLATNTAPALHSDQYHITCIGKGGAYLSGHKFTCLMQEIHMYLSTTPCQVIYLSLGCNDLDSGHSPSQVAHSLFSLAKHLLTTCQARFVFIDQILSRDPHIFPGFAEKVQATNQLLQQLINQHHIPGIRLWHHRNFVKPLASLLLHDGVHLNKTGMARYWRSIRGAILFAGRH